MLSIPVSAQDHAQGAPDAPLTLLQYGDFECPFSGAAHSAIRDVQQQLGVRLRYVFRPFPLADVHPYALRAAQAGEIAAAAGKFWPLHDLLFDNQDALEDEDLAGYAEAAGLDAARFAREMSSGAHRERLQQSIAGGRQNGVHGTPTFFINGVFHDNDERLWSAQRLLRALESAA